MTEIGEVQGVMQLLLYIFSIENFCYNTVIKISNLRRTVMMSNTLVAYFSATGITARVAKKFAQMAETDLLEIKPVVPYTDAVWIGRTKQAEVLLRWPMLHPDLPLPLQWRICSNMT